jgi:hypothetical protein
LGLEALVVAVELMVVQDQAVMVGEAVTAVAVVVVIDR